MGLEGTIMKLYKAAEKKSSIRVRIIIINKRARAQPQNQRANESNLKPHQWIYTVSDATNDLIRK